VSVKKAPSGKYLWYQTRFLSRDRSKRFSAGLFAAFVGQAILPAAAFQATLFVEYALACS
jgi:hypothetical protein